MKLKHTSSAHLFCKALRFNQTCLNATVAFFGFVLCIWHSLPTLFLLTVNSEQRILDISGNLK